MGSRGRRGSTEPQDELAWEMGRRDRPAPGPKDEEATCPQESQPAAPGAQAPRALPTAPAPPGDQQPDVGEEADWLLTQLGAPRSLRVRKRGPAFLLPGQPPL